MSINVQINELEKRSFITITSTMNVINYPLLSRFGPRFPPMSGVYDRGLRKMALDICKGMGVSQYVQEGIYCMVGGPNFESIAEARLLHKLGVDAVGKLQSQ